ncbi:MAG: type II toxin-antitoxin system VapC family toxin [Spirochaetaceae bacterium]|nr:type II toxin-antitoxin system VapC family toxin [Spirochaetaceae bacterium]
MNNPTNVYAESSAILAWLMGEDSGDEIRYRLQAAELVLTSDLALIECDRVLHRGQERGVFSLSRVAQTRDALNQVAEHWTIFTVDQQVVDRARRPFPREPLRTPDAIHLSTALIARSLVTELSMVALAKPIRRNAVSLGIDLFPVPTEEELRL